MESYRHSEDVVPIFIGRGAPFLRQSTLAYPHVRSAMLYSLLSSGADGTWR
jgi:hypothetical protein